MPFTIISPKGKKECRLLFIPQDGAQSLYYSSSTPWEVAFVLLPFSYRNKRQPEQVVWCNSPLFIDDRNVYRKQCCDPTVMYPQPSMHFIQLRFKDKMLFYRSNNILLTKWHLDPESSTYSIENTMICHTGSFMLGKHNDCIFDTKKELCTWNWSREYELHPLTYIS